MTRLMTRRQPKSAESGKIRAAVAEVLEARRLLSVSYNASIRLVTVSGGCER
jgi:hypothetical protein